MASPWEKYQQQESAKPWEKHGQSGEVEKPSYWDQFKRQAGRTGRIAADVVTAVPLMAADAGIATRNKILDENRELPSQTYNRSMNSFGLPSADGMVEQGVDLAGQMLLGSKIPNPTAGKLAGATPSNFSTKVSAFSDEAVKQKTIRDSMNVGYKIPPSGAKPTTGNIVTESLGGKAAVQQDAAVMNQKVTNKLVKQELGIPEKGSLTHESIRTIRNKAGLIYGKIAKYGQIETDWKYLEDLQSIVDDIDSMAKDFPEMNLGANKEIGAMVDGMLKDSFDAKSALALIKQLRKDSSAAFAGVYDPKSQALGHAQRAAADLMEDLIERSLTKNGHPELMGQFKNARQLIAKTYSVDAALNEATGNVIATKIGQQLRKGKPLSGNLEIVGKFAETFPRAAKEITHSPGVSYFDGLISAVGAGGAMSGNAPLAPLMAWPAARVGIRKGILSNPYQKANVGTPAYELSKQSSNVGLPSALLADAMLKAYQNNDKNKQ